MTRYHSGEGTVGEGEAEIDVEGMGMPEVSRFFGISIRMYFDDTVPRIFMRFTRAPRSKWVSIRSPFYEVGFHDVPSVWSWNGLPCIQGELLDNWDLLHTDQPPHGIDALD